MINKIIPETTKEISSKISSKYMRFNLTKLVEEYVAQLNYNGPNVQELKNELLRRGLPSVAENPERFLK